MTCRNSFVTPFQPANVIWRKPNVECFHAMVELRQRARPDQQYDVTLLCEHIGNRHLDRILADPFSKIDGPVAAGKVAFGIPGSRKFGIGHLAAPSPFGEEAARLAGPGEVGDPLLPEQSIHSLPVDAMQPAQTGSTISASEKLFDRTLGRVFPVFSA